MEEQYCLKWNNHQTTLLTVLTGLMDTERLADCILSAEGKSLKAHQVIISACSPYLERLLNETRQPGYMPILIFSDLAYDELVAMKEYMYKGEVNIRQDALDSFLKAACNLQIKGLADGGGGGGSDEGGGGSKRKAPPDIADSPVRAGRRRRRESRESDNQEMLPEQLAQPMPAKKQNVFTAKVEPFEPAPVVKMEPIMDQPPMPQPQIQHTPQLVMKPEPQDQPEPETHDLTGLDDDEDYDYEMPGTSQPDLSQDISSWQMDNSMHSAEDFAASQSMNTSASQPGQSSQGPKIYIANIESLMMPLRIKERHDNDAALAPWHCSDNGVVDATQGEPKSSTHDQFENSFNKKGLQARRKDLEERGLGNLLSTNLGTSYRNEHYKCSSCKFECRNVCEFYRHWLNVCEKKCCFFCPFTCKSNATYEKHVKSRHGREINIMRKRQEFLTTHFLCPYCPFKSAKKESMEGHVQRHHSKASLNMMELLDKEMAAAEREIKMALQSRTDHLDNIYNPFFVPSNKSVDEYNLKNCSVTLERLPSTL